MRRPRAAAHHAPMRGVDGEVSGGVVVATEVTGERRAQEALEQHDARFRALVQRSADAALIADESGVIVWASPAVKQVFGYEPDEVVGTLGFDFVHPEDVAHVASRYDELLAGRPQPPLQMRIRTADGSWCWVEEQLTNLLDEPAVAGVVANLRDITERRRASESVTASEQRYRTIVESAGEGICIFDGEGRVVVANPRLRSMLLIDSDPESLFDEHGEAIVEAITRLAAAIGVLTVTEGVETSEQAEAVERLGCTAAQGYLSEPPRPRGTGTRRDRTDRTIHRGRADAIAAASTRRSGR